MKSGLHPTENQLLAYAEGQLAEADAPSVAAHLASCSQCRSVADGFSRSIAAIRQLPLVPLPAAAEDRIKAAMRATMRSDVSARFAAFKRWSPIAAALVLGLASLLFYYQSRIQGIELHRPAAVASSFEELAVRLHSERLQNRLRLDYLSASPEDTRKWIAQHGGIHADIATTRTAEDDRRYHLQGAKFVKIGDVPAVLIAYRIDDHPVTLLTAKASGLSGIPPRSYLSKRVLYRESNEHKSLSWNSAGQVYTLVSDLPEFGQRSCYICHTDRTFRNRIDAIRLEK